MHEISHLHTFPKFYFCDLAFLAILLKSYFRNLDNTFNSKEQQPLKFIYHLFIYLFTLNIIYFVVQYCIYLLYHSHPFS